MFHTLHRKHKMISAGKEISFLRFLFAIAAASIEAIWAIFLATTFLLTESTIGFITSAFVIFSLVFTISSTYIIEHFNKRFVLFTALIITIIADICLFLFEFFPFFLVLYGLMIVGAILRFECINILFRDSINDKDLNKEEGFMWTLANLGWLIGPLVASGILLFLSVKYVFLFAAFFMFLGLLGFIFSDVKEIKKKRKEYDNNFFKNIKDFISNKKQRLPYLMSMGLEVWWALIYIYVPLFMIKNEMSEFAVALFLGFIIIPLVTLESRVGDLSIKYGFKKFLTIAYVGLTIISLVLFFIDDIMMQLLILCMSSIFVAFLEPVKDTFFFKQTKKKDEEKYFPLYTTSMDFGGFIGRFVIAIFLLYLPDNFAYLAMGIMMLIFSLFALKIPKELK